MALSRDKIPNTAEFGMPSAGEQDDATETAAAEIWSGTPDAQQTESTTANSPNVDGLTYAPDEKDEKDESEDEANEPEPVKYHFRPQTRGLKNAFTRTWMDQDDTGNYGEKDPNEKVRKTRPRNRVRFRLRHDVFPSSDDTDGGIPDDESSKKLIPKLTARLQFMSEAGKKAYSDLVAKLPTKSKTEQNVNFNGYRLRKRGTSLSTRYYSECNLDKSRFASDLPDDLTGHPSARGCWECLGLGIRCPLLDDEHAWPCNTCIADDHDCDLVTPPKYKRTCERCKRKRGPCSYTLTDVHGEACQQCMEDGFRCVAGPAKDTVRTRARYDRDWENDPPPKQKPFKVRKAIVQDDGIDLRKLDDSLDQQTGDELETSGQANGSDKPNSSPLKQTEPPQDPQAGQKRHRDGIDPPQADRPAKKVRWTLETKGETTTIDTKFCHPIIFNYDESKTRQPCHFCSDPLYPLFGLEAKQVEVIEWEDGHGLEEVCGGHKGEGVENTRVCISCTTERIPIILCQKHELRPTGRIKFNDDEALEDLLSGSPRLKVKRCRICPNLARYECCTPGEDEDGCGLLVCEGCMVMLTGMYDGDLQKMLVELKDEPSEERMFGFRADHELLKEDGLLMKYVLWNSQQ